MRILLIIVAVLTASPAHAKPSYGDYVKAARAIEEWRYDEARALVAALDKAGPNDPEVRFLVAEMAFLDGHYDKAQQILDSIDGVAAVKPLLKDLVPLVESTREATHGMVSQTSPRGHFEIFYLPGKDEVLVPLAAMALDKAYEVITADLGYAPPGREKIRVEILPRVTDLARVSTLTEKAIETSGTIALCKYNKLMVVTPRATVFGYAWMDTLAHELAHYIITRATNDRVPIWLHEGLAKFEETRWRAEPGATGMGKIGEHLLHMALRKGGRLITFEEMHPSMALLPSQEAATLAFAEVYAFVAYLQKKFGYEGIRAVLAHVKGGKTERRAIAEVAGESWEDVQLAWKKYLKSLPLKASPLFAGKGAAAARKIRLKKAGGADDENAGIEQIGEERAKKHARLGGLLRARGRLGAAAIEYEKALALVGPGEPFLAAKLARTYLDLGEPAKAVAVIEAIPDRDEDDAGPTTTLGVAYLALGDPVSAEKHLGAALRVQPFDPAVRCGLAEIYEGRGDIPKAEREKLACRLVK